MNFFSQLFISPTDKKFYWNMSFAQYQSTPTESIKLAFQDAQDMLGRTFVVRQGDGGAVVGCVMVKLKEEGKLAVVGPLATRADQQVGTTHL